jgi:hypothetical protein
MDSRTPSFTVEQAATANTDALHHVFDAEGVEAFDRAARHVLYATAGLIAHVRGRDRLAVIMAEIDAAHRRHRPHRADVRRRAMGVRRGDHLKGGGYARTEN